MIASLYRNLGQRVVFTSFEASLLSRCDTRLFEPFSGALLATPCLCRRSSVSTPSTRTPPTSTNTPLNVPLNPLQFIITKRILRRRKLELEATQRLRNLNAFKKEVQKGKHDVQLPVQRWGDHIGLIAPSSEASHSATLRGSLFNRPVNKLLLYQVVRWQRAKRRQPIASTKTKAEVRGGGRKPHAQKGSGRARQGSIRSPHMRGGGVVFGPKPRSFAFKLPKRIRRAGLMAALSTKTQQERLLVVDSFTLPEELAKQCCRQRILELAEVVKQTGKHFVRKRMQRERLYDAIRGDETILKDEKDKDLSDADVADNVLQRAIENEEALWPLFMNTSSFKESLFKLLPPAVRDERLTTAENILSTLNAHIPTGSSIDHTITDDPKMLRMLQTPMHPKNRSDTILVIHSDSGEDCAPLVKPSAQEGTPVIPDSTKLESTMLRRLTANLKNVNCLPSRGANVMDILRHKYLIITEAGLRDLTLRLTRPLDRGFKPAGYDWQQMKESQAQQVAREKQLRVNLDAWLRSRGAASPEE